jgi:asparagine synthase (glutamine-hydrolysing)
MPGLNFICKYNTDIESIRDSYDAALKATLLEDNYTVNTLFEENNFLLGSTVHPGYSIQTFERDSMLFCLEGAIHNLDDSQTKDQITSLSKAILKNLEDGKKKLAEWLCQTDGDFVVFAYNKKSDRFVVFNDVFSRLPIYLYANKSGVVLSRNYNFISGMIDNKEFDPMSIAQYMMLRFSLGDRTHLKNVFRLKPAEAVVVDAKTQIVDRHVVHVFNVEEKTHAHRSVKENAEAMVPLFLEACKGRVRHDQKTILSLSGGLDSRAVAAALKRNGDDFTAMTTLDVNGVASVDVQMAEKVSAALKIDWRLLKLKPIRSRDMLRILRLKAGLVYLGKVHSNQLYDKIIEEYGSNVTFWGGLAGDRILHDIRPRGLQTMEDLVRYALGADVTVPIETASKITGVLKEDIIAELRKEFESYPEKDLAQKYVHFHIYGQVIKWLVESYDRPSCYFNTATPFLSPEFFSYVMACPDRQKDDLWLYTNFLYALNPEMSKLPRARNCFLEPIVIDHLRHSMGHLMRNLEVRLRRFPNPARFIYKKLKKAVAKPELTKKYQHPPQLIECMRAQIESCPHIAEVLDIDGLKEVLGNLDVQKPEGVANIFTLTSMIEYISTGKSSIEKYHEADLGSFNPEIYKGKLRGNFSDS